MLRETKGSVMETLTLDQVREAGRFAYAHRPRRTFHCQQDGSASYFGFSHMGWYEANMTPNAVDAFLPPTGWVHVPGCDCPYCT